MSAIKDGRYPITLDKERHILFSLNILDELQDKAGGYDKLTEFLTTDSPDLMKRLKWLLTLLINEGADEGEEQLTEQKAGKLIHIGNLKEVMEAIFLAFKKGNAGDEVTETAPDDYEEDGEENEKNITGGRGK